MAIACPVGFEVARLNQEIRETYASVARDPGGDFHFHRGPDYAARLLGYDQIELKSLPRVATAPFAGVGNPFLMDSLPPGAAVVDIGSGAGMDCLLAGRRVGPKGMVVGIDMADEMLERARAGANEAGLGHVRFDKADVNRLPIDPESVDVVISNGVINLTPDKAVLLAELYRVLKPGGRLQFADIIVGRELSEDVRSDIDLWTGWIAGALQVAEMIEALHQAGFRNARECHFFDSFLGTAKERVARKYEVRGANFVAHK
jgi:arsenite methyltransferase